MAVSMRLFEGGFPHALFIEGFPNDFSLEDFPHFTRSFLFSLDVFLMGFHWRFSS